MDTIPGRVKELVAKGEVLISGHGYKELAEDRILARDVVENVHGAISVEEYPDYPKGSCVLALQRDRAGEPIHAVWGVPRGCPRSDLPNLALHCAPTRGKLARHMSR